jgi:arylsulfatase A-like enzyme/Flp pilus assembly protein TadD
MIAKKILESGISHMRPTQRTVFQLAFKSSLGPIVGLTMFLAGCSQSTKAPETRGTPTLKPRDANVLLITLDTLRADHVSCYNPQKVATPNIDALAARGVLFAQATAQVPLTTPSHASILTGTYPQVHKVRDIGGFVLDKSVPTLATLTQQAGFETAAFLGSAVLSRHYGLNRGFETYNDDMGVKRGEGLLPGVVAEVRGDVVTKRVLEWLEEHRDAVGGKFTGKNFLLWVHYYDPHFPYDPPTPYKAKYAKDPYAGEVAYTDEQVGHLLKWLEDHGLKEKTLIVVIADHGESLGEHGEYTHGVFLYESTMHVPMIIAGPGVPQGQGVQQQVRTIDVMPTIAEFLQVSPGQKVQGTSLWPLLTAGKEAPSHYSYMETLYPRTSMGWSELRGMRTDHWKMIAAPTPELYNLDDDRGEKQNVKVRYSTDADHLEKKIWEIAGPPESLGKLERQPVDDETLRQLQSLGYVSAGARRELRIDMSGPDPKDRVEVLGGLERSAELMNHDHFQAAIPLLKNILAKDPTNPSIYVKLGVCLERTGQYQKAIEIYQQAVKNGADSDQTHAAIGNNYVRLGQLQFAADAMEKAAEMNLTNLQNLVNLATAYLQLGRAADCQKTVKAVLAQDDHDGEAYNILGLLEIQRGDGDAARGYFEKAIEYQPDLTEPYLNLGLLAQQAGQPQIAIGYYKKFLERARPKDHGQYIPKVKAAIAELGGKS